MLNAPHFRTLERDECEALVARHHVGRLAFTFRDRVDIEPLHYVFRDGWLYGRTRLGAKVETLRHHPWVALEVDEVEGMFRWRSVVVHGHVHFPDFTRSPVEGEQHARATEALRTILPEIFTAHDPVPERNIVFAISADEMSGREASMGKQKP